MYFFNKCYITVTCILKQYSKNNLENYKIIVTLKSN